MMNHLRLVKLRLALLLAILGVPSVALAQPHLALGQFSNYNFVSSTAAMEAFPVAGLTAGSVMLKTGYYSFGDMPWAAYTLSFSACSFNGGAGDLGAQIPSSTPGRCWIIGAQTSYDVRIWGVVGGGTDPYYNSLFPSTTGNAALINNAFTYVGSLSSAILGGLQGISITGGGLVYGVNYPVKNNAILANNVDLNLLALSATNFPCDTDAVYEVTVSTTRTGSGVSVDANFLPVNGIAYMADGTQHFYDNTTKHWMGHCRTITTSAVATVVSGSYWVAMTNTTGVISRMVSIGNSSNGIADRTRVMWVNPGVGILLSRPAISTPTGAVALTFALDPAGQVWGLNNNRTGGTCLGCQSFEYATGDAQASIPGDRYGDAILITGLATNVNLRVGQANLGICPIFVDNGTGGVSTTDFSTFNSNWATTEVNPCGVAVAPDASGITMNDWSTDVPGSVYFADSNNPTFKVAGTTQVIASSNLTETPPALVQVYSSVVANAKNVDVDPFPLQMPTSGDMTDLWDQAGPGSFSVKPNDVPVGTLSLSQVTSDSSVTAATTVAAGTNITAGNNISAGNLFKGPGIVSNGAKYTVTGCGVTNSSNNAGSSAGIFTAGISGTCSGYVTIGGATPVAAPTDWFCILIDTTTKADEWSFETNGSIGPNTYPFSGTTVTGDQVAVICPGW